MVVLEAAAEVGADGERGRRLMTSEPFALDRIENPHPDLLDDALRTRARARNRPWDEVTAAEWRGLLRGMARATGCTEPDIETWMDRCSTSRHRQPNASATP